MKLHRVLVTFGIVMATLLGGIATSAPAAILYKSYIIRQDQGQDILCDPYVVKQNDYITKLMSQRGDIVTKDFPKFIEIFRRLNPHVMDPNQIRPGQHIFIPLKILAKDDLPGQKTGVVTIPFVTITSVRDYIQKYTQEYRVEKGDFVSRILDLNFGTYGTLPYEQGLELFKLFNPEVTNLDLIYPDQRLIIPDPTIRNESWFPALFAASNGN